MAEAPSKPSSKPEEMTSEHSVSTESVVMPFQQYSRFFKPEEIEALTAAYNAAQLLLSTADRAFPADQDSVIERKLTHMILASACKGQRDVARLKETALRGVLGKTPYANWKTRHAELRSGG